MQQEVMLKARFKTGIAYGSKTAHDLVFNINITQFKFAFHLGSCSLFVALSYHIYSLVVGGR
jgi:hypothetical protein